MSSVRPLLPTQHLHSQCGGRGSWKGKEQEEGLGQQEFKTNNKKTGSRKKKEKKTTTKKQDALGQIQQEKKNKKTKTQKDPFLEKKEKRKKFFALFQNFVVKLQGIGPCFQKFPNSLICFKYVFLHWTGFFFFGNRSNVSIVSSICQLEIFFLNGVLFQIKIVF